VSTGLKIGWRNGGFLKKAMFAYIVGVAPAGIAGVQKPWMAFGFHILVL
jgi:hypothetical protein